MSYSLYDTEQGTKRAGYQASRDIRQFAQNLINLMKAKELTHREVARRTGLSASYISMLIRNIREPSLKVQYLIANAIGVKRPDLWENTAVPEK